MKITATDGAGFSFSRRDLIRTTLLLGATAPLRARTGSAAVVRTAAGRLRGLREDPLCVFKGVRYADTTAGANRFRPPRPPTPWTGVREAVFFGPKAPQTALSGAPMTGALGEQGQSEDCLSLNIWTPGIDGGRRPVMVWLHGGGFTGGAGDAPEFDGTHLAAHHDVVVVTLNHRLGALGFLYLDQVSAGRVTTGNLGLLDVAAALRWIRVNIAGFGGNPDAVTLFGESGGGRKVATLSAMPVGRGLYQRMIVQSGPATRQLTPARASSHAAAFLEAAGVPAEVEVLQAMPLHEILAAQAAMQPAPDMPLDNVIAGFAPVVDGVTLPHDSYAPSAPEISADVPMMIGTNRWEQTSMDRDPPIWDRTLSPHDLRDRLQPLLGRHTDAVLSLYRRDYPALNPAELLLRIDTDRSYWINSVRIAERRAAEGRAPTFVYRLDWETPVQDGKLKTPHGLDVPLVFDTVEVRRDAEGPGTAPLDIARCMSATWAAFARNGAPDNPLIPSWSPYALPYRSTMSIDVRWTQISDPDADERQLLGEAV